MRVALLPPNFPAYSEIISLSLARSHSSSAYSRLVQIAVWCKMDSHVYVDVVSFVIFLCRYREVLRNVAYIARCFVPVIRTQSSGGERAGGGGERACMYCILICVCVCMASSCKSYLQAM